MGLKRYFVIMLILLMIFSVSCSKKNDNSQGDPNQIHTSIEEVEPEIKDPEIPKAQNPLTGTEMDMAYEKQRPLAVMVENEYNARPQSGLDRAGIVYEILAEGGITRFLALYLGEDLEEIGPVRSARPYFLDYAMEYDSIYIHYGASPQGYIDIKSLKLNAIDGIYDAVTFWRDKSRKEPHNAYTSIEKLLEASESRGFLRDTELNLWVFNSEDLPAGDQAMEEFHLEYFNKYTVSYTYDDVKKQYKRFINGKPHTDRNTGDSIYVKNIIVQFLNTKVIDDVGRLSITTVNNGEGYYISNGCFSRIKWQKEGRSQRTQYTLEDGSKLSINKGNTWIQIMPQWGSLNYDNS